MVMVFPAKETGAAVGVGFSAGLGSTTGEGFGLGTGIGLGLGVGVTLGAQANSNARIRESEIDNNQNFCLVTTTPPLTINGLLCAHSVVACAGNGYVLDQRSGVR
ncbi:MAG: hypothetical protein HYX90_10425 [Chloroflexi bacterium]|nr:hypothetical protein [Chloroflexota bacterium]